MARLGTDVKIYRSSDPGAPTLTGSAGKIVNLLKTCLVDGYNEITIDSMTRNGSIVTCTVSSGNIFPEYAVIEISGAIQNEYNGLHRVQGVSSTQFTFELPEGVTPETPATGTITAKIAPAGWEMPFISADNNRAVFKSADPSSTGLFLYVDDTNAATYRARVKGYESVTDIDTRTYPFPYSVDDSAWVYWRKSSDSGTARDWTLIADSRLFYLYIDQFCQVYAFGDVKSFIPGDSYNCIVAGDWSESNDYYGGIFSWNVVEKMVPGAYIARGISGSQGDARIINANVISSALINNSAYAYYSFPSPTGRWRCEYPLASSGGIMVYPVVIREKNGSYASVRGIYSGAYDPSVADGDSGIHKQILEIDAMPGRIFLFLKILGAYYQGPGTSRNYGRRSGAVGFDIIGPWEH